MEPIGLIVQRGCSMIAGAYSSKCSHGTFSAHKRWKMLAKGSLCRYPPFRSGAMSGLLVALVLAIVALMAPTAATSLARADTRIELEARVTAVQFAASPLSNVKRTAVPCLPCTKKACGACAIACSAYCAAGAALLSRPGVLAPVVSSGPGGSIPSAPEGIGRPPDPPPPRTIVIS